MTARAPAGGGAGPSQSRTRSRRGTSLLAEIQHKRAREELGASVDASAEKTSIQGPTKGRLEGTQDPESRRVGLCLGFGQESYTKRFHIINTIQRREGHGWTTHSRVLERFRGERARARPEGTTLEEGVGTPHNPGEGRSRGASCTQAGAMMAEAESFSDRSRPSRRRKPGLGLRVGPEEEVSPF